MGMVGRVMAGLAVAVTVAASLAAAPSGLTVRAGDRIVAWPDSGCTSSFAFTDGRGGNYLTVAGHCVALAGTSSSPRDDEYLWANPADAPVVTNADGVRIGTVRYLVDSQDTQEDFALIRLDAGVAIDPDIPGIGVPNGVSVDYGTGRQVRLYGHGQVISSFARNRSGIVLGRTEVLAMTTLPASTGDSGGPVVDATGAAFGVLAGIGAGVNFTPSEALAANGTQVMRLDFALARARQVTGLDLQLVTKAAPAR